MVLRPTPPIKFHRNSEGVTLSNGVAGELTSIIAIKIRKGLGVFVPGRFQFVFKVSTAVHENAEIYWGYKTPAEPRRTTNIGNSILYTPFKDLPTHLQRHTDHRDALNIDLGIFPGLALIEDETLVISLWAPSGVAATVDTRFEIPYFERTPGDLAGELELRRMQFGGS